MAKPLLDTKLTESTITVSGGFGANNSTPFGQNRPAFGASTTSSGTGLFGGGTATAGTTTGFGGFGSTANNNNTSGGSLFGSTQKPAFGGGNTGGGLFGSASPAFGSTNQQTSAFGTPISSALGTNNAECQGTGSTPFQAYTEKEGTGNTNNHFQSISFMAPYKNFSFEVSTLSYHARPKIDHSQELRLADYNQGRRFGNASGQPAAFGQTNFGGFGQTQNTTGGFGQSANNTGGGLFGQSATTSSSPFGTAQPAQSGFGTSNTGGGLFGQKPATSSGLFGQGNTASTSQQSGGIFGTSGGTTGGFGSGTGTGSGFGTAGGLFGSSNQQQQQSKPFSFGTTATTGGSFGTGNTGFGNTNNTANTGGGLFGNAGQTNAPFGQTQQQPAQQNPFGGFGTQNQNQNNTQSAFGGFGAQQQQDQKPGGLFGNQNANNTGGGGLFGNPNQNNQQQASTGGLFGTNNNIQSSGSSLFAPKPAATGGSLFGTANTGNTNQGGGVFSGFGGNNNANQNQQNQSGGLFGNGNQQQKPGGLFGNSTGNTGGGMFGGLNNNNTQSSTGGSLFGSNNQQQQQGGSLFGNNNNNNNNNQGSSLFGNLQQQQQQPNALAAPPVFNASLIDPNNAYGSPSIFSGLPPPPVMAGPIATPINIKQKMKKSAVLPHYKMAPNAASRLVTPQKRGFGFSYSTYGTPGSAASNASTPGGLNNSLMFGSIGRGLGKSLSTSNLRRNFDSDSESILTPGAFSAGSSRYGGAGSLKKLTIDRSLRTPDLFGDKGAAPALPSPEKNDQSKQPGILKKKVSFDASTVGGNGENQNGDQNGANGVNGADVTSSATPSGEEQGFPRTPSRGQGRFAGQKSNGIAQQPEMEQVRGNELAVVHEDESPDSSSKSNAQTPFQMPQDDQQPGPYWMKPSESELQKLPKDQRKQVKNFSVGREGCGRVEFNTPVDLSFTDLKDIYGNIVLIELRSLTVYPDQTKKPALGKGLNVPSTIFLANSWPRQKDRRTLLPEKSGPRFNKHVDRLRKVGGTEFVRYEKDTGIWVFKVPHFTTYGFDYDEDEASEGESLQTSVLSEFSRTPTPVSRSLKNGRTPVATTSTQRSSTSANRSSDVSLSPEDTFEFRKRKILPGSFEYQEEISDNEHNEMEQAQNEKSFLDGRLAASPSDSGEDEPSEIKQVNGGIEDRSLTIRKDDEGMDVEMVGAFPSPDLDEALPRSVFQLGYNTPGKGMFNVGGDWAQELQRTISPRKQDRQALRETQAHVLKDRDEAEEKTPNAKSSEKRTGSKLATSIDVMNSIFGQEQARRNGRNAKQSTKGKGVKV